MGLSQWLLVAALVDAAIGVVVVILSSLLFHRRLKITSLEVTLGAGVVLAAAVMQAAVLLDNGFSRLHLSYLALVVAVPVVGALVLVLWLASPWATRLEVTRVAGFMGVGLVTFAAVGFYGTYVEPYRLRTDEVTLDVAQIGDDDSSVRVGVLADLQTRNIGAHEWNAIERLNQAEPDLVVMPGDFLQGNEQLFLRELPELRRLLGAIEAPAGVFIVAGDSDSPERVRQIADGTAVRALVDEVDSVSVNGRTVWIGGVQLSYFLPEARDTIDRLAGSGSEEDLRLLVSHRPDVTYLVGDSGRIDAVLAGHTHGGQVALPFLGPPITLSDVPRSVGAGGLHTIDGQPIYVGTGVGMERGTAPQVRFLVRPSVGLVEIR